MQLLKMQFLWTGTNEYPISVIRREVTETHGLDHVNTEVQIEILFTKAEECLGLLGPGRNKRDFFPIACEVIRPCKSHFFISSSRTLRIIIFFY